MIKTNRLFAFIMIGFAATSFHRAVDQTIAGPRDSLTTEERVYGPGWWPTQTTPPAKEYAGEAACAACHGDISAIQHTTAMYQAAARGQTSARLTQSEAMTFHEGADTSSLGRDRSGVTYTVSDGTKAESLPVAWSFGSGEIGQSYLLQGPTGFIEGRVSFYTGTNALDITTGHSQKLPGTLQDALGHVLAPDTAERCFSCHTTEATLSSVFAPQNAVPGVTCEACHGPGARHVDAMRSGRTTASAGTITNPEALSPAQSADFCGACHRTSSDVAVFMPANLGASLTRFQPYRLEKSRCWGQKGDARITCIACHDPHQPLVRAAEAYDAKCLACHGSRGSVQPGPASTGSAAACRVGTSKCVACHMPKVEVPQTHASFTDHYIRVVRSSAFPR